MKTSFVVGTVISLAATITFAAGIRTSAAAPATAAPDSIAIRPFNVPVVPQGALDDLRKRVAATRWPEKETVADMSQGVQLATMQKLARYWANDYDWRKCEAKLKALPQFVTTIDGLDIQFIHARSKDPNANLYPEHWLQNIRTMLHERKRDEAARSLAEFRKMYPDYHLPDDLRDLK